MQLTVTDLKGAVVSTTSVPASSGAQTVLIPMNVAKGCYILSAVQGAAKSTYRVVVNRSVRFGLLLIIKSLIIDNLWNSFF